jgi:hypothetical protein
MYFLHTASSAAPSHSNVSEDVGSEPRTIALLTGTVRVANQYATS